jgi:hypothetical protein
LRLHGEGFERIPDPADLELLSIKRAILDGGTVVVGHQLVLGVAPVDGGPVGNLLFPDRPAADQEIARTPIDRGVEFRVWKTRARHHRLEIAGQQAL